MAGIWKLSLKSIPKVGINNCLFAAFLLQKNDFGHYWTTCACSNKYQVEKLDEKLDDQPELVNTEN